MYKKHAKSFTKTSFKDLTQEQHYKTLYINIQQH